MHGKHEEESERSGVCQTSWDQSRLHATMKLAEHITDCIECASQVRWESPEHRADAVRNIVAGLREQQALIGNDIERRLFGRDASFHTNSAVVAEVNACCEIARGYSASRG